VAPIGAGGGLAVVDAVDYNVNIESNYFHYNIAYHGGGFYEKNSYNLRLANNIFSENDTYRGGAIGMYHLLLINLEARNLQKITNPSSSTIPLIQIQPATMAELSGSSARLTHPGCIIVFSGRTKPCRSGYQHL